MKALDELADEVAPAVRLEPCAAFRPDLDCPWCSCLSCGWSEDEHPDAVVLPIRVRSRHPVLRQAS